MNRQEITAQNNGIEIHGLEFNRKDGGIPLLIIPGAINSAEEIEAELQGKLAGHHIIMSLRGRGKSSSPESGYSLDDQASDVLTMVNHLKIQEVIIFGYSLGSTIGIEAAGRIPERIKGFIMGDFPPFYPPFDKNWADHILEMDNLQITSTAAYGMAAEASYTDVSESLQKLNVPILLMKGEQQDSAFPMEQTEILRQIIPKVEICVLSESGHDIFRPNPEPLIEVLERFTSDVATGQRAEV